jgi:hypothetical protein
MRAVPAADEPQMVFAKRLGDCVWLSGIRVSELAAGVARPPHVAQDGREWNIARELVKIIVAPNDRIRTDEAVAKLDRSSKGKSGHRNEG